MLPTKLVHAGALGAAIVCTLFGVSLSQDGGTGSSGLAGSVALESSEVASASVEAKMAIRDLLEVAGPDEATTKVEASLVGFENRMVESEKYVTSRPLGDLGLHVLEDAFRDWERYGTQLTEWGKILSNRSAQLTTTLASIERARAVWEETQRALTQSEGVPSGLLDQCASVLEELGEVDAVVRSQRGQVLELQNRVSKWQVRVNDHKRATQSVLVVKRSQLLTMDSEPLWRLGSEIDTLAVPTVVTETNRLVAMELREFYADGKTRLLANLIAVILFVVGMVMLRRRGHEWDPADELMQSAQKILRRPVSATLILSLIMVKEIYPQAPLSVYQLAAVLVIIPLAILVPKLLPAGVVKPAYGLFVLFFAERAMGLLGYDSTIHRLLLLTLGIVALGATLWWLARGRSAARLIRPWNRVTSGVAKLAAFMFVASITANVVGAVGSSALLAGGMIWMAFLGVLIYVTLLVVKAAAVVVLNSRLGQFLRSVRENTLLIRRRVTKLLTILGWAVWIGWSLDNLRVFEPIWNRTVEFLTRSYTFGSLTISITSVLTFAVTIWIATLMSRFVRFILNDDVLPRLPLARGVPSTISKLTNYAILTAGFTIALAAAGIPWSQFAIVAGGLGVGIGFGLQNLVNNFVSGLILMFERPIQVGDTIEVGALIGRVRHIGIRASTVRTYSGAEVIVPNGDLLAGQVINWTLSDMLRRVDIAVGVEYGTDPGRVIELLSATAGDNPKVLKQPEPFTIFKGFGESSLDFELRFWTSHDEEWMRVKSEVTVAVNGALREAGMTIPFPQRDLHVRSVAHEAKGVVPQPKGPGAGEEPAT